MEEKNLTYKIAHNEVTNNDVKDYVRTCLIGILFVLAIIGLCVATGVIQL